MGDGNSSYDRRTVLQGLTTTIGATAIANTAAASDNGTTYTGVSYCPVTDKKQTTASAVLNQTPDGLKGHLSIADFDIKIGQQTPLKDTTSHPNAERYTFTATQPQHTTTHNGEELGLKGRIDTDGTTYTGILTRPAPAFGDLAFSLAPSSQGFSSESVASILNQSQFREIVPGFDAITIPETGIPTQNSARHLSDLDRAITKTDTNTTAKSSDVSTSGTASPDDPDVGVLDSKTNDAWLSESLPNYCDDKFGGDGTMSWTLGPNVTAERRYDAYGNIESEYDEIIQTGDKIWRLQVYLEEIPDPVVELCDQKDYHPYQANVQFNIRQAYGTTTKQARLQNPKPDDDTDDSDDPSDYTIGTVLNVVSALGGPYASIASTLIDYALTNNPPSSIFNYNDGYDQDREEYSWDLPLDSYNEDSDGSNVFADTTDNTVGVEAEIANKAGDGKTPEMEANGFYTWSYLSYVDDYCPCTQYNTTLKTNSAYFGTLYAEYTSINDPDS